VQGAAIQIKREAEMPLLNVIRPYRTNRNTNFDRIYTMAIPDFQTLMLPLMRQLASGNERSMKELYDLLAKQFSLSEAEQKELLPSGQQSIFRNRVAWAKAHLKMAGIVESPSRGRVRLTARGTGVVSSES